MAENKNSFILYKDLIHVAKKLPLDKLGELFLHILKYVNDENPVASDLIIDLTFEPIKQHLKRDSDKYKTAIVDRNRTNGLKGGRPKNNPITEITQSVIIEPKKADSVSVSENVIDNDILLEKETKEYPLPFGPVFAIQWKAWLVYKKSKKSEYKNQKSIDSDLWDLMVESLDNEKKAIEILSAAMKAGKKELFGKEKNVKTPLRFNFKKALSESGADEKLIDQWLAVRRTKHATNTELAFEKFIKEVSLSGKNINEVLTICITSDWRGFEAAWLDKFKKENGKSTAGKEPYKFDAQSIIDNANVSATKIESSENFGFTNGFGD